MSGAIHPFVGKAGNKRTGINNQTRSLWHKQLPSRTRKHKRQKWGRAYCMDVHMKHEMMDHKWTLTLDERMRNRG